MKAGVASENGLVVRDIPQPRPKPNAAAGRADEVIE
jgi:hypothetical protein